MQVCVIAHRARHSPLRSLLWLLRLLPGNLPNVRHSTRTSLLAAAAVAAPYSVGFGAALRGEHRGDRCYAPGYECARFARRA
ncbi:unnamed protein product [Haemonchus placei]|uniref:Secreted protein n=1 Tax=Haemonchus placei TaxID=6290 RepID=A0A0N4W4G3_HAEPC|nr:unnamed protein product [Haemonchus placei]